VRWEVSPGSARRHAYKVREALFAAAENAERFPELAAMYGYYNIVVESSSSVLAVPRVEREVKVQILVDTPSTRVIADDELSCVGVLQAWRQRREDKVYLPNHSLTREDLVYLWQQGEAEGYVMFEIEGALTLTPRTEDLVPLGWNPDDVAT